MTDQRGFLTYGKLLEIVTECKSGKSLDELASTFNETRSVIQSVLNRQPRLEKVQIKRSKRSQLSLADKLLVVHEHKIGTKPVDIQLKFNISQRTYYRILASKDKLRERDNFRESPDSKRAPHPKYPQLELRVTEFISFAREN